MIDYAEELRSKERMSVRNAIYYSAKRRMRPIFLTSAAASVGVIPMILGGSGLWMPMGTVIFYGTLITMSVNDDAIALKGGKGPQADKDATNGENKNIIIEDCTYGFSHSALTCGSESIHNRNIILRRCTLSNVSRLLWLKMRPDTPQRYEYILVEDIKGDARSCLFIKPCGVFLCL